MGINISSARPPIVSSDSLSATGFTTAYNWNRPAWMFPYPVVGNPWQPSAALRVHNQAVSGGLCPTSQDPLDSVRELFSGLKDSMKAEISFLTLGFREMNSPESNHKKPQNWKKAFYA
jgi:hypothetical protein